MKLDALDSMKAFALLGPGYGDGEPILITGLRAESQAPQLLYAAYESLGSEARGYAGQRARCSLEIQAAPPLEIQLDDSGYGDAIDRIRASIAAGDVYQVNHSLRARLPPIAGSALANALCRRGVPRYFAWVRFPEGDELISASPECFFSIDGERIRCEPMKGTSGPGPAQEAELLASEKDRAELFMITDLMRNDLIPICAPGSVHVLNPRRFLRLPYAVQAVSDIEGRLTPGSTARDALIALHPGGSITGAPKRAAMKAIAALETSPRGAYCGSLGFIDDDKARFSILIRTAQRDAAGWSYGVGGGIVWQSNAADERRELEVKLGALR
jgi:anthranilate/para-aminobenzoate synthase component I